MDKEIERNIVKNSIYMVSLFNNAKEKNSNKKKKDSYGKKDNTDNFTVINLLKLQILMYLLEAYYMVCEPTEKELYDSNWNAWEYGPANKQLYNYFRDYGGTINILLSSEDINKITNLPDYNKNYIDEIYKIFGNLSVLDLVSLTHMNGSPWNEIIYTNKKSNKAIENITIDKEKTKQWFEKVFKIKSGDNK